MQNTKNEPNLESYRYWSQTQFDKFKGCVAFISGKNKDGAPGIGTCFHVGEGVFVIARHVVESMTELEIGFDDNSTTMEFIQTNDYWDKKHPGKIVIIDGPHYHPNETVDVACFKVDIYPKEYIPLGGHLEGYLDQYDLVLHRTLILGYPLIPLTSRPILVASLGEINALADLYVQKHPHFLISTMARGGFSGGPALVAYNELNINFGTAALGLVTQSLTTNEELPQQGFLAVLTVDPIYACLEAHGLLPIAQRIEVDERDA